MRHNEYLQHKRELDERLSAGIALLEAAHRTEVRALEALWASFGEEEGADASTAPSSPAHLSAARPGSLDLYDEVLEGLGRVPHEFGARDVSVAMGREIHRASLHRVLLKLSQDGVIAVKDSGLGRRATIYLKLLPAPETAPHR
jgi:hypothetical protein